MIKLYEEFHSINEAAKAKEVYSIAIERSGTFGNSYPTRYQQGTLEELIKAFSYDLEVGASWQHEKGNKKINRNPKTVKALCDNLYNAKNNAAANGYGGYTYSVIKNEDNPKFKTNESEIVNESSSPKWLDAKDAKVGMKFGNPNDDWEEDDSVLFLPPIDLNKAVKKYAKYLKSMEDDYGDPLEDLDEDEYDEYMGCVITTNGEEIFSIYDESGDIGGQCYK